MPPPPHHTSAPLMWDFGEPHLVLVERSIGRVVVVEQEHVDEVNEDTGGLLGVGGVVHAPLEDDHEHQVTEETDDEDHLRDKLQDDVHVSPEIPGERKEIIKCYYRPPPPQQVIHYNT